MQEWQGHSAEPRRMDLSEGGDGAEGGVGTSQGTAAVPAWTAGAEAASVGEAGSRLQGPCISLLGCITVAGEGSGQWPCWWAGDEGFSP